MVRELYCLLWVRTPKTKEIIAQTPAKAASEMAATSELRPLAAVVAATASTLATSKFAEFAPTA